MAIRYGAWPGANRGVAPARGWRQQPKSEAARPQTRQPSSLSQYPALEKADIRPLPPQCGSSRCRSTQRERILIGHRASRRSETLSGHRHSSRKVLRDPALRSTIYCDKSSSTMSFRGRGHTQQRGHGHTLGRFRGHYGRGRGSYGGGRAGGFTAPPHASGLNLLPSNGPNGHGGKGGKGFIASLQVSAPASANNSFQSPVHHVLPTRRGAARSASRLTPADWAHAPRGAAGDLICSNPP